MLATGQLDASFVVGPPPADAHAILFDAGVLEVLVAADHRLFGSTGVTVVQLRGKSVIALRREVAPELWDVAIAPLVANGAEVEYVPKSARREVLDRATRTGQLAVLPSNFRASDETLAGYAALSLTGIELPVKVYLARGARSTDDRRVDALLRLCAELSEPPPR